MRRVLSSLISQTFNFPFLPLPYISMLLCTHLFSSRSRSRSCVDHAQIECYFFILNKHPTISSSSIGTYLRSGLRSSSLVPI
jgi:hypothetical protein